MRNMIESTKGGGPVAVRPLLPRPAALPPPGPSARWESLPELCATAGAALEKCRRLGRQCSAGSDYVVTDADGAAITPDPDGGGGGVGGGAGAAIADFEDDPRAAIVDFEDDPRAAIAFRGGEAAGLRRLDEYCTEQGVGRYKATRNGMVGKDYSTKFSPWLAVGAVSARQVYWRVAEFEQARPEGQTVDTYWVVFELMFRDFFKVMSQPRSRVQCSETCAGESRRRKEPQLPKRRVSSSFKPHV
jgi:hypothetical protein